MAVSYKKLWKLLIDKDMKRKDLEKAAGISHYAMTQLSRSKDVSTGVLRSICNALDCSMEDIVEFIPEEEGK